MNQLADFVLMYERNIREAVDIKRQDMNSPKSGGGASGHTFISDPTAQKAIRNIMDVGTVVVEYGPSISGKCNTKTLRNAEKWLRIVDETWKYYKGRAAYKVMVLRYKEGTSVEDTARELGISKQRIYVLLDTVHRYVISSAKGTGAYQPKIVNMDRVAMIMEEIKKHDRRQKV